MKNSLKKPKNALKQKRKNVQAKILHKKMFTIIASNLVLEQLNRIISLILRKIKGSTEKTKRRINLFTCNYANRHLIPDEHRKYIKNIKMSSKNIGR